MKLLRLPLCAALAISLLSGCSSSSTTASSTPAKSPDDQAKELIAKLGTLTPQQQKEQGPIIAAQILALREQVSAETRQQIDFLIAVSRESSQTASRNESSQTDSDSDTSNASGRSRPTAKQDSGPNIPSVQITPPERAPAIGPTRADPELGPQPREVK